MNAPNTPNDERLDDLQYIAEAHQNAGPGEPPDLLDQAILNRARAAVQRPVRAWPWNLGWPHALGTAAVAVVALSLLLQLREEVPAPPSDTLAPPATPVGNAPRTTGAVQGKDDLEAARSDLPQSEGKQAVARQDNAFREQEFAGASADTTPATEPAFRDSRATEFKSELPAGERRNDPDPGQSSKTSLEVVPAPASVTGLETRHSMTILEEADEAMSQPRERLQDLDRLKRSADHPDPQAWLAWMRELLAAGELDELDRQRAQFVEAYPDHPLPADLAIP